MNPRHRLAALALATSLAACVSEPVEWGDVRYRDLLLGDPDARSAIMSAGLPQVTGTEAPCIRSIRAAGAGAHRVRAWWSSRSDSSVVLSLQQSSSQGSSWELVVEVDSRDRGRRGCSRPAAGIYYDGGSGYVYVSYFIEARDGAGVFFAHSMDDGIFHSPVPVVYGNTPSRSAVAGHGDTVVVVFEDPNSTSPRVGIALSRTTGHMFDQRSDVTSEELPGVAPWVALNHDTVTVWWRVPDRSGSVEAERVGYRSGVWR